MNKKSIYQGVKFQTKFLKKIALEHPKISELKKWCKIFHAKDLAPPYPNGSFGNLSFRTKENAFIITGSRIGLKNDLQNDSFVQIQKCDLHQKIIYVIGIRKPSSETMLHAEIYRHRKDVNAIFHGHCHELLEKCSKLKIPETSEEKPYGTIELVKSVLTILKKNKMIMMKNHGFIALGKTMQETGNIVLHFLTKAKNI